MKLVIAFFAIAPFVLAWAVQKSMCQPWFPLSGACPVEGEHLNLYLAFLIMFAIAFWVGGGLMFMLMWLRHHPGPEDEP